MTSSSLTSSKPKSRSEVVFPLEGLTRGLNLELFSEGNYWWVCMSSAQNLMVRRSADSKESEFEFRLSRDFTIEVSLVQITCDKRADLKICYL